MKIKIIKADTTERFEEKINKFFLELEAMNHETQYTDVFEYDISVGKNIFVAVYNVCEKQRTPDYIPADLPRPFGQRSRKLIG